MTAVVHHHLTLTFTQFFRIFTVAMLAIAAGAMARFYRTRPGMPWGAFVSFALYTAGAIGSTIAQWDQPFVWFQSPLFVAASASTIYGVGSYLSWRRP